MNRTNSWKVKATLITLIVLLGVGVLAPALGHLGSNSRRPTVLYASASSGDPIATGNAQQDQYDWAILQAAQSHNLNPFIVKGVVAIESQFDTNAVSQEINDGCGYTHDLGLMQVNPYCSRTGSANLFDPLTNLNYGSADLESAYNSLGSMILALQAYNIGAQAVQNGARNPAYSNQVMAYVAQFQSEHNTLYGTSDTAPAVQRSIPQTSGSSNTYTVIPGDTLSLIGQTTGTSWQAIASANGISAPYIIFPGQVLRLSTSVGSDPTYTVHVGDYIYTIAQHFSVSWEQIAAANGIPSPYIIQPGQALHIP